MKNWAFTAYEHLDLAWWEKTFNESGGKIRYMICGQETCPKTKKKHIQGYLQLEKKQRRTGCQKLVKEIGCHWGEAFSSAKENIEYCQKDGAFQEWGVAITKGARTDIRGAVGELKRGGNMMEVAENNPEVFVKYSQGLFRFKEMVDKKESEDFRENMVVKFVTGPTGCGKTRLAMENDGGERPYLIHASEMQWWCGYQGELTLVIDEYNNDVSVVKLLGLLDGYQKRLPFKGGQTYARWKKVWITSNLKWAEIHTRAKQVHKDALERRVTEIVEFAWVEREPIINDWGFSFND